MANHLSQVCTQDKITKLASRWTGRLADCTHILDVPRQGAGAKHVCVKQADVLSWDDILRADGVLPEGCHRERHCAAPGIERSASSPLLRPLELEPTLEKHCHDEIEGVALSDWRNQLVVESHYSLRARWLAVVSGALSRRRNWDQVQGVIANL